MTRMVLGALLALSLLYGAPARADAPTIDLATASAGPDTAVPYVELASAGKDGSNATYRLTAGAQTITFRRSFTGADPNGADSAVFAIGGGPRAWLIEDNVPEYVGGRSGWSSYPKLYRLTPDGRLVHLTDPPAADDLRAGARFYATLPFHGDTVSIYRIATGRLVARRVFPGRGYHTLGPIVGHAVVVNIGGHATQWSLGTRAVRHLPNPVQAMAGNTIVFQLGSPARLCSRVAPADRPRQTLWTICGAAGFESLSPDGQRIVTVETFPRFGLRDRSGNLLAYYENVDDFFGWTDGSTVSFSVDGTDNAHPYVVATCAVAACHRGPGHADFLAAVPTGSS